MRLAVVGIHTKNIVQLYEITVLQNKLEYCRLHGYRPHFLEVPGSSYDNNVGFAKLEIILTLFNQAPDLDWAFYTDCDAMITNLKTRLEDKIESCGDAHVILGSDFNGINAGQFFVRNSEEGRNYLQFLISQKERFKNHKWHEQQAMMESQEQFKGITVVTTQRFMNSYVHLDGKLVGWKLGDFIVHWPNMTFGDRLIRARSALSDVIH